MKINEIDLNKLIPLFMRDDETVKALSSAINDILKIYDSSKLRTWDQIDKLTENELDDLANELNIPWYNKKSKIEIKRQIILDSDNVWKTLGTRYAVEAVIFALFGSGELKEFFEYEGGRPHHFKIDISDPSVLTEEGEKEFRRVLELVKRKSQILDTIQLVLEQKFKLYLGSIFNEKTTEQYEFIPKLENEFIGPNIYLGFAVLEDTIERHKFPS